MIKIIHSSILCKWANLQNQPGLLTLLKQIVLITKKRTGDDTPDDILTFMRSDCFSSYYFVAL